MSCFKRLAAVLALAPLAVLAATLRVPGEYPDIQSAIDACSGGDTVLVAVGVYHESLLLAFHTVTLLGEVEPDSGEYARPVIDPSTLDNPGTRRCITINGGLVTIAEFGFRNGAAMYPRSGNNSGGIVNHNDSLVLSGCVFDSVYIPVLSENEPCVVERCIMRNAQGRCIDTGESSLRLVDSWVSGQSGWGLVDCGRGSFFLRSRIGDNVSGGHLVLAAGGDHLFQDCVFERLGATPEPAVWGFFGGSLIERCIFRSCTTGGSLIMATACDCGRPLQFRDNLLHQNGNASGRGQGGGRVMIGCADSANCHVLIAENNVFVDGSVLAGIKALGVSGVAQVRHNRFERHTPVGSPAVFAGLNGLQCRENFFHDNGFAADADVNFAISMDARFNWWGNTSGPRSTFNPNGTGDSTGLTVDISDWYADTTFFADVPERTPAGVASNALQVFPNPFNATATLRLTVPAPQIVRIELFDLLGRHVREIFVGPVAYQREFSLNADALASGIYFARAQDTITRQSLALTKLAVVK